MTVKMIYGWHWILNTEHTKRICINNGMNGIDINEDILLFDYLSGYFSNYLFSRMERVMDGVKNQIEIIE